MNRPHPNRRRIASLRRRVLSRRLRARRAIRAMNHAGYACSNIVCVALLFMVEGFEHAADFFRELDITFATRKQKPKGGIVPQEGEVACIQQARS